jgi:hypothetical protein
MTRLKALFSFVLVTLLLGSFSFSAEAKMKSVYQENFEGDAETFKKKMER